MRLGIRAKLVGTLLLAGLLPLALALAVILIGVVELRIQSRGRMYRALAQQQARHLSTILASQVETANLINGLPGTVNFLQQHNARPPLSPARIAEIEAAWPAMNPEDHAGLLHDCLDNDLARRWQSVRRRAQDRFAEVMVTDATGRLVAATNKTSDYYQADEAWWQNCYNDGRGRVLISDVIFDESAISPQNVRGTLVADLCLPIYDDAADPARRKVVGVTKISLDAGWMLHQLDLGTPLDELPRATWLVRSDGKAVSGGGTAASPPGELPPKVVEHLARESSGWIKADTAQGREVIGFAAVEQSRIIEDVARRWHVVVATPTSDVVASVYRLAWVIIALGVPVIAACFIGGLVIARREVIRPLLTLENAVNQLKAGNRDFRLSEQRGGSSGGGSTATFRDDEIGRLAHDFNTMADQLKSNLERLEHADAVKREFIDLASHELRTPVTYILGAAQLAQRHEGAATEGNDAAAANAAAPIMAKISAKAQRLNRIVENMFKLLASDRFDKTLRTTGIDVAALLRTVVQELDPFVKERAQRWDLQIAEPLPTLTADAEKLRDIFTNLVSNAVRFSPDGGVIRVLAAATATTDSADAIEVTVADSGPGIPEADLPRLFEPFFTGGAVSRHTSGDFQHMSRGMGLGLSVVKRFVDLHGGAVTVQTSPTGTQFHVTLPLKPPAGVLTGTSVDADKDQVPPAH
jgi:signal transduction histidine kinase